MATDEGKMIDMFNRRLKDFSTPLCYYSSYNHWMEEAITPEERRTHRFYGVTASRWKKEWGEPEIYIVDRPVESVINAWQVQFVGDISPIFILMAHNIGRLEEYVGKPIKKRVGHDKYVGTGVNLSPKEVLCEVARWETLFYALREILDRGIGFSVKEYMKLLDKIDPFDNESNKDTILRALKKCGEYKERGE